MLGISGYQARTNRQDTDLKHYFENARWRKEYAGDDQYDHTPKRHNQEVPNTRQITFGCVTKQRKASKSRGSHEKRLGDCNKTCAQAATATGFNTHADGRHIHPKA